MFYFYILKSETDDEFYFGSTSNLKRRFHEHNSGKVESTKYRRPFRVVYYEAYENLLAARVREKQVKASGSIRKSIAMRIR